MVGDEFSKLYVCYCNKWNPYSDEVKKIPDIYWSLYMLIHRVNMKNQWNTFYRPHAELIAQIANPDAFKVYWKYRERDEKMKQMSKEADTMQEGQDMYEEDQNGASGASVANSFFDPVKGLVDSKGNVLIPKEKYEEMLGLGGAAISY